MAETPAPLHALLFDMDGTLVDSEAAHGRIWAELLQQGWGVVLDEASYRRHHAGLPTLANALDLVARFGLAIEPAALARHKAARTRERFAAEGVPLRAGARELLDWAAAAGLRLALVTGASHEGIDLALGPHGLLERFETRVGLEDVAHNKPAPDGYRLALQRLGLAPAQALALEDSQHGVAAARAAGLRCLALPTAVSAGHDFGAASRVLPDLAAALAWLRRQSLAERAA